MVNPTSKVIKKMPHTRINNDICDIRKRIKILEIVSIISVILGLIKIVLEVIK